MHHNFPLSVTARFLKLRVKRLITIDLLKRLLLRLWYPRGHFSSKIVNILSQHPPWIWFTPVTPKVILIQHFYSLAKHSMRIWVLTFLYFLKRIFLCRIE